MMVKVVEINKRQCNGCGICILYCQHDALTLQKGVVCLDDLSKCVGDGNCLDACNHDVFKLVDIKKENVVGKLSLKSLIPPPSSKKSIKDATIAMQLSQAPIKDDIYNGASLLIAANCTAYNCPTFHQDIKKKRLTLFGCPKIEQAQFYAKIRDIILNNNISNIRIVRMDNDCCNNIEKNIKDILVEANKIIPWHVRKIDQNGDIL